MKCLCGKEDDTPLFQSGLYDVMECVACGQVRITARRGAKRTGYYKEEDVRFYIDHQDMFRRIFRQKLGFIHRFAPHGTMLDVGAGVGLFLDEARKMGYDVIGFEPSKASVAAAKKHFGIRLDSRLRGNDRGGIGNDRVDIIVINHVLEHLANPHAVINLCAKTLGGAGTLVIGVPNFDSFMRFIKRGKWQSLIPREHRWQFTLKTLDRLVIAYGFRRIALSYENHDRAMHYWWKKPIYAVLDRIALMTGHAEAMLVIYRKLSNMKIQNTWFVIVTYKPDAVVIRRLLEALEGRSVVVVENGGEVGVRREIGGIRVIKNERNVGYCAGANAGMRVAFEEGAQWVVVMNQDIEVTRKGITQFCAMAQKSDPGIIGPEAGSLDPKRWTTILPNNKKVDYISGSMIAIHRNVYEATGGFYEPYFMYYEDVDLCVRAKKAGFALTSVTIEGFQHEPHGFNVSKEYYLVRNHLLFVLRNAPIGVKLYELLRLPKTLFELWS